MGCGSAVDVPRQPRNPELQAHGFGYPIKVAVERPLQPVTILGPGRIQGRKVSEGFLRSLDHLSGRGWLVYPFLGRPIAQRAALRLISVGPVCGHQRTAEKAMANG
jgi:hypothetical protein